MEYCLSLPTWLWCEGGRNRSLARQAFARHLPAGIVERTSKGGPDSFSLSIFERHRASLRGILLDGAIAAAGLVDREAVEQALYAHQTPSASARLRLLSLADAEAWAQSWINKPPRRNQDGMAGPAA
jgi:asparagine synthase (glutamine-hydrolysing)